MRPDSPWYITAAAVREYAAILGLLSPSDADFDRCEDELVTIARAAKFVLLRDNGTLQYSGAVPSESRKFMKIREHRLVLIVSTAQRKEGPLPQLVAVAQRGAK